MMENYLIIYDIQEDNTKYSKIYKILNKYYAKRIQKSVFLVQEDKKEMAQLTMKLKKVIDQEHDKLLIIPLCDDDWNAISMFGIEKKEGIDKKEYYLL